MTLHPDWFLVVTAGLCLTLLAWSVVPRRAATRATSPTQWCRLATAALLVAAALRPVSGEVDRPTPLAGADVVVLVDRTTSMGASDYGGRPRMEGVTADLISLSEAMPGARVSVIAMDNQARTYLPASTDPNALRSLASTIGWREHANAEGSDISVGVPAARNALEQARDARPAAKRFFVYMGDGEQTAETTPRSFSSLAPLIDDSLVLGYGTARGAPMAMSPSSEQKVMRGGAAALSHADMNALETIASQTRGTFRHRTSPGGLEWWQNPAGSTSQEPRGAVRHWAWWFAAAALMCECADLWMSLRAWRRVRQEVA